MTFAFTLAAFAIIVWVVSIFTMGYLKATSSGFQRVIDGAKGSATMLVAQLGTIAAALIMASDSIVDFVCNLVNAPGVADQVKTAISQYVTPTNLGLAMLGFTLLVGWARSRTLGK